MGLVAVGIGVLRFRSVGLWLFMFGFFYLMTCGPYLRMADVPGDINFVLLGGKYAVKLPYAYAFKYVPLMSRMFAPYRMGCMVMLAMGALLALNLGALMRALGRRRYRAIAGLLFLAFYFGQFFGDGLIIKAAGREGYGKDRGLPVFTSELKTHSFYDRLAEEEGQLGVVHLPLMYQQDLLTYLQTVHNKKVLLQSGWANDGALPPLLRNAGSDSGETTRLLKYLLRSDSVQGNSFVESLLALNNPPHTFQPYRASDVGLIYAQGYRYLLLHERGCYLVRPDSGTALYSALRAKLIRRFGKPVVEVKEFKVDDDVGNKTGHVVSGVSLGWVSSEPPLIHSQRPLSYHLAVFRIDHHVVALDLPRGFRLDPGGIAGEGAPLPAKASSGSSEGAAEGNVGSTESRAEPKPGDGAGGPVGGTASEAAGVVVPPSAPPPVSVPPPPESDPAPPPATPTPKPTLVPVKATDPPPPAAVKKEIGSGAAPTPKSWDGP